MMDRRGKDEEGGFSRGIADDESLHEKLQPTKGVKIGPGPAEDEGGFSRGRAGDVSLHETLQPSKGVAIGPNDVLCGRGRTSFNHVGNKRFRNKVSEALPSYTRAENRYEKSIVSHAIVNEILQTGGRFLKQNVSLGVWVELSEQEARDKVGHAVRDAVAAFENRRKRYRGRRKSPDSRADEEKSDKPPPPSSVNLHQALASLSSTRAQSTRLEVADTEPLPIEAGHPSYFETASVALPSDSLSLPDLPSSSSTLSPYVPSRQQPNQPQRPGGGDPHDHFLAAIDSVLGPLPPGETDPMGRLLEQQRQSSSEARSVSGARSGSDAKPGSHPTDPRQYRRDH